MAKRIAVTGANGFVGRALCAHLHACGHEVYALLRREDAVAACEGVGIIPERFIIVGELQHGVDLENVLAGVDVVVHCAARVHVMAEAAADPLGAFRAVNVEGTRVLADAACAAGVGQFIFLSSIKVNGERTLPGQAFTAQDDVQPQSPYGQSKWEAEQYLQQVAEQGGMKVLSLRLPLVYGPGVKANYAHLAAWVGRGWPLPLGAVRNQRSLLALDTLVAHIAACIAEPQAMNYQLQLVADGEPVSTPQLLRRMAEEQGVALRLWWCPVWVLRLLGAAMGQRGRDVVERLVGDLVVEGERSLAPGQARGEEIQSGKQNSA